MTDMLITTACPECGFYDTRKYSGSGRACRNCGHNWDADLDYAKAEDAGDDARIAAASRREWAERAWAAEAERDKLRELIAPLATEARCRCMYESRETERAYENGECDHQLARAALKGETAEK